MPSKNMSEAEGNRVELKGIETIHFWGRDAEKVAELYKQGKLRDKWRPLKPEDERTIAQRLRELRQYKPRRLSQAEDVHWKVPGVLINKGITCLVGEAEAGKTTLSLQLSKALLYGEEFLGLPTEPLRRILWIELDESVAMLKEQAEKIQPTLSDELVIWDDVSWDTNAGELTNLVLVVFNYEPQLIVIDALNSIGINENDNSEIAKLYRCLRAIAEHFNLSILLLHHLRKLQPQDQSTLKRRVRGAGDIVNKADCVIGLEREGYAVTLSTIKLRGKDRIEKSLRQDPDTLVFTEVKEKSELIRELWQKGKPRAEIIDFVWQIYDGKKETIAKAVDREKKKLIDEGKLVNLSAKDLR